MLNAWKEEEEEEEETRSSWPDHHTYIYTLGGKSLTRQTTTTIAHNASLPPTHIQTTAQRNTAYLPQNHLFEFPPPCRSLAPPAQSTRCIQPQLHLFTTDLWFQFSNLKGVQRVPPSAAAARAISSMSCACDCVPPCRPRHL